MSNINGIEINAAEARAIYSSRLTADTRIKDKQALIGCYNRDTKTKGQKATELVDSMYQAVLEVINAKAAYSREVDLCRLSDIDWDRPRDAGEPTDTVNWQDYAVLNELVARLRKLDFDVAPKWRWLNGHHTKGGYTSMVVSF